MNMCVLETFKRKDAITFDLTPFVVEEVEV